MGHLVLVKDEFYDLGRTRGRELQDRKTMGQFELDLGELQRKVFGSYKTSVGVPSTIPDGQVAALNLV